jgi:hypothetical protein
MLRPRLFSLVLALAVLAAGLGASPALAAKRKVPFGMFGAVMNAEMGDESATPGPVLDQQMDLMARSGVESVRTYFSWQGIERTQGNYDWSKPDRIVGTAARHGLSLLASVQDTPRWASTRPDNHFSSLYAPKDPDMFGSFMGQFVRRYGPKGSFWTANPQIPRVPIRQWQIWNEQVAPWFWRTRPWAKSYVKILKSAYKAIHKADRRAKVVPGAFVGITDYDPWDGMRDLYRAGGKRYFDMVAVHPFAVNAKSTRAAVARTFEIGKLVRRWMRRYHDARKPMIWTEVTWPAAIGRIPKRALLGFETTAAGQRARLKGLYSKLARVGRRQRITQAYWFQWATQYDATGPDSVMAFRYSGLTKVSGTVFSPTALLRTYTKVAARYQGCRKSSNARRCAG